MNEKDFRELEKQAKLLLTPECQELLTIQQTMIYSLSRSQIDPAELKGMMKLIAKTLGLGEEYAKEKEKQAKE